MRSWRLLGGGLAAAWILTWILAGSGQVVEFTRWDLPTAGALPYAIALAEDGTVYFTEFGLNRIGQLDPTVNEIREREVGGNPLGLVLNAAGAVFLTLGPEDALELLAFAGGGARWPLPNPGSGPSTLVPAPTGPGEVNLWLSGRNTRTVVRFSPSEIALALPEVDVLSTAVAPVQTQIPPRISAVPPEIHPGGPALPPSAVVLTPTTSGPFTEWHPTITDAYIERVAMAPNGWVWFTQGEAAVSVLDPETNTVLTYGIPSGSAALAITVAADGKVWFTDTARPAIGVLDPESADVRLWPIPGGRQPFALALDEQSNVWFTDREGDVVGVLSPSRDEIALYALPAGSHPLFLALDAEGAVWFTTEEGNFLGRLLPRPVVAEPLVASDGGFEFRGYGVLQIGNQGWALVFYSYDGRAGLPLWIGLEMLHEGKVLSGFILAPGQISEAGTGAAGLAVEYQGEMEVTSDRARFTVALSEGRPPLAVQEIEFAATWSP